MSLLQYMSRLEVSNSYIIKEQDIKIQTSGSAEYTYSKVPEKHFYSSIENITLRDPIKTKQILMQSQYIFCWVEIQGCRYFHLLNNKLTAIL